MELLEPFKSQEFTDEQKQYLLGFFSVAADRAKPFVGHTATGLLTDNPTFATVNDADQEEETYFGTPVSDLCREEIWKHEENPLDIWDKLIAHANEDRAPAPDDLFRFKFHGLFYVAPAQDSFMLRLRIPGGILTAHQMRGLAAMAADWGSARADITTRANLQIREFQPEKHSSSSQQAAIAGIDLARIRRRQHSQHNGLADCRHRSDRTVRRSAARRCTPSLHS